MPFYVQLTDDAVRDLEVIYKYIYRHDTPSSAEYVLDRIESVFQGLPEHPQGGSYPGELLDIGVREYREVFFKPYRIIYLVAGDTVYVLVIADGRRDMQTLLQRRLLQG